MKGRIRRLGGRGRFQRPDVVKLQVSPEFAEILANEATGARGTDVVLTEVRPSACHESSMNYVMQHGGDLWSGFALNDQVWRVHSWVVKDGQVIETTPIAREAYVGAAINSVERAVACFQVALSRPEVP
jgi:hypothetical protein